MQRTVVRYTTQSDTDTFSVVKKVAKTDRYGGWMQSDEKTTVLASGMQKWNAEYAAAALEYMSQRAKAPNVGGSPDAVFDASNLDSLKQSQTSVEYIAYAYVRDTLGSGWAIYNAYKLTGAPMIDMWLKGSSFRFGVLPLDIDRDTVFKALSGAINKIIDSYGMR